jgi:hypothetical protein
MTSIDDIIGTAEHNGASGYRKAILPKLQELDQLLEKLGVQIRTFSFGHPAFDTLDNAVDIVKQLTFGLEQKEATNERTTIMSTTHDYCEHLDSLSAEEYEMNFTDQQLQDEEEMRIEHEAELRREGAQDFAVNLAKHIRNNWEQFSEWGCFEEDLQDRYEVKGAKKALASLKWSLQRSIKDRNQDEHAGLKAVIKIIDDRLAELKPRPTVSERVQAYDAKTKPATVSAQKEGGAI